MLRIRTMACGEQRRGADQLALLVAVNRMARVCKLRRAPAADLDECQALPIQQDKVNLAPTRAEVTRNGPQAAIDKITKGELLGVLA